MRSIAFCSGLLLLFVASFVCANEIEVREARLQAVEDGLVLDTDFDFVLTPRLAEVVSNGVPLYFRVHFELTPPRWYWFDETAAAKRFQLRLASPSRSRQSRVCS